MEINKVIYDGVEYPVTYKKTKAGYEANAIINGFPFNVYGREQISAYFALDQHIYSHFNFKLGVEKDNHDKLQ
ncbi:MAG: hypothetical protein LBR83_06330 [Clostridiales bacterium]|jgi:hypothetical protein|nr:hypothetical protein [Clostridiales bacterium]